MSKGTVLNDTSENEKKMRNELKTKRLLISPLTDEELEELIISTEDEGLKIAYSEMLEGAMEDVKNRNWYAP